MAPEKQTERNSMLAAAEAKRDAWQAVVDSLKAAMAIEGSVDLPSGGFSSRPMDLPVGVFRDKGIKEAIPILLEAGRRKQTNKEIAQGLKDGGIATMSANFEATVGTALLRLKDEGIVLRFSDGWDLAASYPDSLKNRLEKDEKPSRKRGKANAPKKNQGRPKVEARTRLKPKATKKRDVPKTPPARANVAAMGLSDRLAAYLQTRGSEFTPDRELALQLKIDNLQVLRMTLGKMLKAGKIERDSIGQVRLTRKIA